VTKLSRGSPLVLTPHGSTAALRSRGKMMGDKQDAKRASERGSFAYIACLCMTPCLCSCRPVRSCCCLRGAGPRNREQLSKGANFRRSPAVESEKVEGRWQQAAYCCRLVFLSLIVEWNKRRLDHLWSLLLLSLHSVLYNSFRNLPAPCVHHAAEKAAMNFQDVEDDDALLFVPRSVTVPEPQPQDVICGRGKSVAHPGNQRLAELIKERKEEYQKANRRDDKTRITYEIVQAMQHGPTPARYASSKYRVLTAATQ